MGRRSHKNEGYRRISSASYKLSFARRWTQRRGLMTPMDPRWAHVDALGRVDRLDEGRCPAARKRWPIFINWLEVTK